MRQRGELGQRGVVHVGRGQEQQGRARGRAVAGVGVLGAQFGADAAAPELVLQPGGPGGVALGVDEGDPAERHRPPVAEPVGEPLVVGAQPGHRALRLALDGELPGVEVERVVRDLQEGELRGAGGPGEGAELAADPFARAAQPVVRLDVALQAEGQQPHRSVGAAAAHLLGQGRGAVDGPGGHREAEHQRVGQGTESALGWRAGRVGQRGFDEDVVVAQDVGVRGEGEQTGRVRPRHPVDPPRHGLGNGLAERPAEAGL